MTNKYKKHIQYVNSLLDRYLNEDINGEELNILFNNYCGKYFDWKGIDDYRTDLLEQLNESLSFYEPNPRIRKDHKSYLDDNQLKKIVSEIKGKL